MKGKDLYLALLSGISLALAFPPLKVGFLAYGGLVPLFFLLEDKDYRRSLKWGYLTGLILNLGILYWIGWITLPGAIAAILYSPLFLSLYALIHTLLRKKFGAAFIWLLPFLWTSIEYIKSLGVLGFTWTSLGHTQTYYLPLIQFACYTSVYGVSFWIVLVNVLIYWIILNRQRLKKCLVGIGTLGTLFLLPFVHGWILLSSGKESDGKIRIALLQGNIDPKQKWDEAFLDQNLAVYLRLTRRAGQKKPDLIVWPETATACFLRSRWDYREEIQNMVDSLGIPLLTGSPDYKFIPNGEYLTYNGAFLIQPHQWNMQSYHKIILVPFGERVPFEDTFPIFNPILERFNMGQGDFSPGEEKVILDLGSEKFALIICYESIFPDFVREFIQKGAEFLVVITNDAWFGRTSAPYQHAQIAVFRAIENRISVARCANTGVSMFIDPYGRVLKSSKIFVKDILIASIPLRREETFYTRHGNIFTYFVLGINLLALGLGIFRRNH